MGNGIGKRLRMALAQARQARAGLSSRFAETAGRFLPWLYIPVGGGYARSAGPGPGVGPARE